MNSPLLIVEKDGGRMPETIPFKKHIVFVERERGDEFILKMMF